MFLGFAEDARRQERCESVDRSSAIANCARKREERMVSLHKFVDAETGNHGRVTSTVIRQAHSDELGQAYID